MKNERTTKNFKFTIYVCYFLTEKTTRKFDWTLSEKAGQQHCPTKTSLKPPATKTDIEIRKQ